MRIRTLAAAGFAAALIAGIGATPASADFSGWCSDNVGGPGFTQVSILTSPIVVGLEIGYAVTNTGHQAIVICYKTAPVNQTGGITGGNIVVDIQDNLATPSAQVAFACLPDAGIVVGPTCSLVTGAALVLGALPSVGAPPSSICLVNLNGSCAAFAPGLRLATGTYGAVLTILGITVPVIVPGQCVAVLVGC